MLPMSPTSTGLSLAHSQASREDSARSHSPTSHRSDILHGPGAMASGLFRQQLAMVGRSNDLTHQDQRPPRDSRAGRQDAVNPRMQ